MKGPLSFSPKKDCYRGVLKRWTDVFSLNLSFSFQSDCRKGHPLLKLPFLSGDKLTDSAS